MSDEARTMGRALMERPTVTTNVVISGSAVGETLDEIADKANAEAFEFFGAAIYALDIEVEPKSEDGKRFARWRART